MAQFGTMPFSGTKAAECQWTVKQLEAEIVAHKGTPPVNNRKKTTVRDPVVTVPCGFID